RRRAPLPLFSRTGDLDACRERALPSGMTARPPSPDESPDLARWRALAKKALGLDPADDAGFERALVRRTEDGVVRGPLQTRADLAGRALDYAGRPAPIPDSSAVPGALSPWDIRVVVDDPHLARANAAALEALEGGATSLELKIDPAGKAGV